MCVRSNVLSTSTEFYWPLEGQTISRQFQGRSPHNTDNITIAILIHCIESFVAFSRKMATVGIVPSVISCETSSRRGGGGSRPRASRRGSTGGIGIITQLQSDEMAMKLNDQEHKPRRRASDDGASSYTPAYRRSSNEVLDILSTALHKNEHIIPRELLDLDVSPTVLQESLQVAETTAKQQRRYSTSNISADVWKPKVKASDDSKSSGSGRRSEPPVTTNDANRSGRSTKSSQQSLDQHKAFSSSHRAMNNVPGRRPRGNSPTSNPTITNSAITSRRRNSAPCGGDSTTKRQRPPPIEEIYLGVPGNGLRCVCKPVEPEPVRTGGGKGMDITPALSARPSQIWRMT